MAADIVDINGKKTVSNDQQTNNPTIALELSQSQSAERAREAQQKKTADSINRAHDSLHQMNSGTVTDQKVKLTAVTEAKKAELLARIEVDPHSLDAELARMELSNVTNAHLTTMREFDLLGRRNMINIQEAKTKAMQASRSNLLNQGGARPGLLDKLLMSRTKRPSDLSIYQKMRTSLNEHVKIANTFHESVKKVSDAAQSLLSSIDTVAKTSADLRKSSDDKPGSLMTDPATKSKVRLVQRQIKNIETSAKKLTSHADETGIGFQAHKITDAMNIAMNPLIKDGVKNHHDASLMKEMHKNMQEAIDKMMLALKSLFARIFGKPQVSSTQVHDYGIFQSPSP